MRKIYFLLIFCLIATISNQALADCTNPAKTEGTIIYNTDYKVAQFCNGTQWVGMAGGTTSIMTGDTMVDGWPDAITCDDGNVIRPFFLRFKNISAALVAYQYNSVEATSNTNRLNFNPDGSYSSSDITDNCDGKSIAQLYADGQAFNFVGGQPVITDTLTDLSCTDGQMVLYDTATTAWVCADVSASGAADNLGNHTATQDLDMANNNIQNVASVALDSVAGAATPKTGSPIPSGFIGAFDLAACPDGWSEYTAARGRFLRGIDPTGTIDPDGVRTAGSVQEDELKSHSHSGYVGSNAVNMDYGSQIAPIGNASIGATGGAETRPKNVAVLYCRKD